MNSNPPLGMWQATGEVAAQIPTLPEIKHGSFSAEGWSHEGQMERRGSTPHEIHKKRRERTSSATTRSRRTNTGSRTPGTIHETVEYFPAPDNLDSVAETKRVPTTINEGSTEMYASTTLIYFMMGSLMHYCFRSPYRSNQKPSDMVQTTEGAPSSENSAEGAEPWVVGPDETGTYPNGYRFPKKHTWSQSTVIGLKAFWKFFLTPFGFLITIYGLNVVAWGAMIFFVLLNAAPAMCHPSCNALSSARKKWIEIDSQILNALFCVTGFGLIPWRFRDFYFLMKWRIGKDQHYFRRLAGIHSGWFRLPGSDHLADDIGPPPVYDKKHPQPEESPPPYSKEEIIQMEMNPAIPLPVNRMPPAPLTGIRAPPTKPYKLDIVIWMYLWNTILQGALAGCMWGFNRFNRPSATTGIFITLGCLVAMYAGLTCFLEGKKIKAVEGVPVHEYDVFETVEEAQERMEKEEAKHHKKDKKHGDASTDGEKHGHHVPALTRKHIRTHKAKGRHWYERH